MLSHQASQDNMPLKTILIFGVCCVNIFKNTVQTTQIKCAGVVKLADALDSKSSVRKYMSVQVRPSAPRLLGSHTQEPPLFIPRQFCYLYRANMVLIPFKYRLYAILTPYQYYLGSVFYRILACTFRIIIAASLYKHHKFSRDIFRFYCFGIVFFSAYTPRNIPENNFYINFRI